MLLIKATEKNINLLLEIDNNIPEYIYTDERKLKQILLNLISNSLKEAVNGKEAVEIWQDWQPHLIWMDIGMPVMDGFQATLAIRKKESMTESSHQTIIIALTAHAFMEEKGEILAVGCEEVVNKPFIKEIIFEKLRQFLKLEYIYNFSSVITPSVTNVDKSDISEIKRKILVAEDNLVNQKLVVNLLNKLNYTVKIAKDGEEVIEILKKEDYDLIFMDIEMPKIDGIKATEIIYQEFSHRQIPPLIAMSAHEDENIISVCKSVGMKDYICKPIKQDNLKLILEKYIGVKS